MASIADVFFKALLDTAQLQVDAVKAGNKAGETMGSSMSKGLKSGLKTAAFAGLTAGLAIATKGVMELETVTADFQATTGATAEEAKAAGKAINAMAGSNLVPIKDIGEALATVETDLGLTGDAAVGVTKDFLKFGRATKQGPAAAVKAFDDILDAWNLKAEDSAGIMDKLIVSHQKYGGSIEESQAALAAMAPALQAANMSMDDGIGLLNLFAVSGVDASVAATAMTKALTKVKSPEELKALIEDIRNTEDPFLRAEKAAKLFGARAGAKLANVLKPGMGAMEDFQVTAEDAAGATKDAAAAMDGTFGARMQLLLAGFKTKLVELGSEFGPVLLGLSSLASLGATLHLDRVIGGIFGGLTGGTVKAAVTGAAARIGLWFAAAFGTVSHIAGVLAEKFSEVAQHVGLKIAASRAGTIIGGIFGSAMGGFANLGEMLARNFMKIPGMPRVVAAVTAAGGTLGAIFQVAFLAGIATLALGIAGKIDEATQTSVKDAWAAAVEDIITTGTLEGMQKALAEVKKLRATMGEGSWLEDAFFPTHAEDRAAADKMAADLEAAINASLKGVAVDGSPITDGVLYPLKDPRIGAAAGEAGGAIEDGFEEGADGAGDAVETAAGRIVSLLGRLRSDVGATSQAAADALFDPILKAAEAAQTQVDITEQSRIIKDKDSTKAQVREATLRRVELQKNLFLQLADLTTYGTDAQRIAAIQAALASDAVANAYRDGTPEQRAAIDEWKRVMTTQMVTLQARAGAGGTAAGTTYAGALADTKPTVTAAGKTAVSGLSGAMDRDRQARSWGDNLGDAWIAGVAAAIRSGRTTLYGAVLFASAGLHGHSPPKVGPLKDIDTWGENIILAWAEGMLAARQAVRQTADRLAAAAMPSLTPMPLGSAVSIPGSSSPLPAGTGAAQATASAGGDTYNINVPVQGLIRARDPLEVAGELRRLADFGVLAPKKTSYA